MAKKDIACILRPKFIAGLAKNYPLRAQQARLPSVEITSINMIKNNSLNLVRNVLILLSFVFATLAQSQVAAVDSNGNPIGLFLQQLQIGDIEEGPVWSSFESNVYRYHLVSARGYQFLFDIRIDQTDAYVREFWLNAGDVVSKIWFESPDCSGQAFVFARYPGFLMKSSYARSEIFYVHKDSQIEPTSRQFQSYLSDFDADGCVQETFSAGLTVEAFPNDPAVTGFVDSDFMPPITFETSVDPGMAQCLFNDSFECPAILN